MPPYPVRAIVLRKTKLGETDIILTLLAADGRQLRAVAKGMRKPGSRFGGRLEPYSAVDLLLHSGRQLDVVTEVETVDAHAALREDFDRASAAAVVADILDKIAVEGQVEERLFGLAQATFAALEAASIEALLTLVTAFMLKSMAMHGYRPELETCACCAEEVTGGRLFSLDAGGVLCPACGETHGGALRFSQEARSMLGWMMGATMRDIGDAADTDPAALRECFDLLRAFVGYHLHARLKALDFYAGELS